MLYSIMDRDIFTWGLCFALNYFIFIIFFHSMQFAFVWQTVSLLQYLKGTTDCPHINPTSHKNMFACNYTFWFLSKHFVMLPGSYFHDHNKETKLQIKVSLQDVQLQNIWCSFNIFMLLLYYCEHFFMFRKHKVFG